MPIIIFLFSLLALEIYLFIEVGGQIGSWPTVGLIFGSAIIGIYILRIQGIRIIHRARVEIANKRRPVRELAHGAALALAAVMLLTPGFITDTLGVILLVPILRHFLIVIILKFIASRRNRTHIKDTIDADYKVLKDDEE
ncbi:MAG: hypothetical protein CMM30_03305 [Rhodospirillaceae bacterium]|nr:hypothetical protein [Alphaproteobacteria bacterium]MBR71954.1 hypothetical protein [Rhodospirillaceae bacterium]|tara:strand:- start:930 stop:1349 length:420 start_codon:yes stop_codon:yes gene_type:complete